MEAHSRAICGVTVFTGVPSARNTALALRQAIWRKRDPEWAMCGIPDILHSIAGRAIGAFITTDNHRPHRELEIAPWDGWVADGWLPRMPESLEELDGLFRTVPKNGVVQRDGIRFQAKR